MPSIKKVCKYLRTRFSRRLRHLKEERDEVCRGCEHSTYRAYHEGLSRAATVGLFCTKCGCPAWSGSDITKQKTVREKVACPLRLWPGDKKLGDDAIDLQEANELSQICDRAELAGVMALKVLEGDIKIDDRIRAELGIPNAAQREARQRAAAASPGKGCGEGGPCGGSRAPAPPTPGAVPADKFKEAFPDHGKPGGEGRRNIVANRSDDRYGPDGVQPQQVVAPHVEPHVETERAGQLSRRSIWEPAGPPAAPEKPETSVPSGAVSAVVIAPEPEDEEADNGG